MMAWARKLSWWRLAHSGACLNSIAYVGSKERLKKREVGPISPSVDDIYIWSTKKWFVSIILIHTLISFFFFFFFLYTLLFRYHSYFDTFTAFQSKNTCAHNNTQKAHANGIKKKKRTKYVSTRGMDPKFLRNQKFCKKYNGSKRPARDDGEEWTYIII